MGWVQLRLEEPLAARARDRLVIRAYSPVTTIGGGEVAEPMPLKRKEIDEQLRLCLTTILDGDAPSALCAVAEACGWGGARTEELPVRSGLAPQQVDDALVSLGSDALLASGGALFCPVVRDEAERVVLAGVDEVHRSDPLEEVVSLAVVRATLPRWAPTHLADAVLARLVGRSDLELIEGGARRPAHRPEPTSEQLAASDRLEAALRAGGLAAPFLEDLPDDLTSRHDLRALLRRLERQGVVGQVAEGFYVTLDELDAAIARVEAELGGRKDLGPGDFRQVLPVSRKWMIPLLNYLDGRGVTVRTGPGRDVPLRP